LGSVRVGRGVARVGTKLPMCIGSGRGPALQLESEVAPRWAQVGWVVRAGLSGLLILGCAGCSREGNVPGWFCLYECIAFSTIVFSGYGMNL
jgi:hypothetical protein